MDRVGLATLRAEVEDDLRVASEAVASAADRLRQGGASGHESCAYQLVRFFNIIEQMGLRVARAFENHIDDERGWHAELVHRLSVNVPGVRPALYRQSVLAALREFGLREHTPPACRFRRPAGNLGSRKSTQSEKIVAGKGSGTESRPGRPRRHAGRGALLPG